MIKWPLDILSDRRHRQMGECTNYVIQLETSSIFVFVNIQNSSQLECEEMCITKTTIFY